MNNIKNNTAIKLAEKNISILLKNKAELLHACDYCGAVLKNDCIVLKYLDIDYTVYFDYKLKITPESLSYLERIYLLHYLNSYTNKKLPGLKNKFVSYNNLSGGMFYYSAFRKNGPAKILKNFGKEPDKLLSAVYEIGGKKAVYNDISVKINVFPKIDLIIIMYMEDDEFPPEVKFLFNYDITNYLCLEDISLMSGVIAEKLISVLNRGNPK